MTPRKSNRRTPTGIIAITPEQPAQEPLYTLEEVETILRQLKPVPYDEPIPVAPGIRACYAEAGHMLGSTSIKLFMEDGGLERTVIFSGDLGPKGAPILRDYDTFSQADVVFLESTYGGPRPPAAGRYDPAIHRDREAIGGE